MIFDSTSSLKEIQRLKKNLQPPSFKTYCNQPSVISTELLQPESRVDLTRCPSPSRSPSWTLRKRGSHCRAFLYRESFVRAI